MKPANPRPPTAPAPAPEAEPDKNVTLLVFTLTSNGLLSPRFTFKLAEEQINSVEEIITKAVEELPDAPEKILGRPATKLIVTAVNKEDPKFLGGEDSLDLGEIISVPALVSFFNGPDDRTSTTLVRYYLKRHEPFVKYGYTVRALEDFERDLRGPAARDFQAIAEAHIAWAKANNQEPFQ